MRIFIYLALLIFIAPSVVYAEQTEYKSVRAVNSLLTKCDEFVSGPAPDSYRDVFRMFYSYKWDHLEYSPKGGINVTEWTQSDQVNRINPKEHLQGMPKSFQIQIPPSSLSSKIKVVNIYPKIWGIRVSCVTEDCIEVKRTDYAFDFNILNSIQNANNGKFEVNEIDTKKYHSYTFPVCGSRKEAKQLRREFLNLMSIK
jgi:hypothetical protein